MRPAETPAPEPVVSNVTPLRVTPGSRSGSGRSLTPEERSVALLTGWQRERQRHAAHGSRVTLWISSVVVVLGLVGAFYLMRPTLIASGRLPAWLGGPQKTTAQQTPANGQSQARNATSSSPNRTTAPPQERADDSQVSAWDSSERDELLAELRERAHASPGDPEALEGMPPEERSLEGWPPRERTDPPHVPTTLERNGAEPVNERATAESPGAGPMDEATITDPPMRGEADAPTTLDAPADESASVSRTSERIGAAEDVREEFRSDPALLAENPAARAEPESSEPFSEDQDEPLASGSAPVGSDPSTNAPVSTSTQSTGASGSPSSGSTQSDPRAEQGSAPGSLQQGQAGSSQTSSSLGPISHAAEATIQVSHAERDGSSEGAAETAEGTGVEAAAEPVGTAPAIAPGDSYVVHLGSFRLRREADAEVARLLGLGYDARALHVNVPGKGPWYRVVIGAFATFEEARENALILATTTGRNRPNVVGAGGYGAPVPILEESESPGKATP